MGCAPVNRPQSVRRQAPLRRREIAGVADGVIPVYRRSHGTASCSSGGSVAEIGVYGVVCYIGVSNSIPVLLPPLQDSASYGSGQNAGRRIEQHWTVAATRVDKMPVGFAYVMVSSLKAGIRAGRPLSLHPLGPRAAWAQPRTGTPDAEGGHGRSCGPGCEARAAPSPAGRRSVLAIPASP